MDGLYWKNPIKMDDLGVPLFLETPIWFTLEKTSQNIHTFNKKAGLVRLDFRLSGNILVCPSKFITS